MSSTPNHRSFKAVGGKASSRKEPTSTKCKQADLLNSLACASCLYLTRLRVVLVLGKFLFTDRLTIRKSSSGKTRTCDKAVNPGAPGPALPTTSTQPNKFSRIQRADFIDFICRSLRIAEERSPCSSDQTSCQGPFFGANLVGTESRSLC